MIFAARAYGKKGGDIWTRGPVSGIEPVVDFSDHMPKCRHAELKRFMSLVFADESLSEHDPWWRFSPGVELFNANRKKNMWSSIVKVFDESTSAFVPKTTPTANLPHLSKIDRKPKPIGTIEQKNYPKLQHTHLTISIFIRWTCKKFD